MWLTLVLELGFRGYDTDPAGNRQRSPRAQAVKSSTNTQAARFDTLLESTYSEILSQSENSSEKT